MTGKLSLVVLILLLVFTAGCANISDAFLDSEVSVSPAPAASQTPSPLPSPSASPAASPSPPNSPKPGVPVVMLSATQLVPGDYVMIYVKYAEEDTAVSVSSKFAGKAPVFFPYGEGKLSIFAIDYRTAPGDYNIHVIVKKGETTLLDSQHILKILPKAFPKQYMTVTKELLEKRSDTSWNHDVEYTGKAKSVSSPVPLWDGKFAFPCEGKVTAEYGLIRYINNVDSGRHSGLDISTPKGTAVYASNSGRIALSMTLIVTGNTIIIDHGMNLFSSYCHLDSLLVKEGEMVEKGQLIGKVGSTGFSTGPHLHWGISVVTTYLDPWLFLNENPLDRVLNMEME